MSDQVPGRIRHVVRPPGLHRVGDGAVVGRLTRLRIPPAWTDVWAAPDPGAAIQATGVDARGRTQYRYSAAAVSDAASDKFAHLAGFAAALPALRQRVADDLGRPLDVHAATAAAVRFLDRGLLRVGNDRYARDNHTYGLTTLRRDQVAVDGGTTVFDFVGKEHLPHHIAVTDAIATAVVRALLEQPGGPEDLLFAVADGDARHHIDSVSVNAYLHTHGEVGATAKVFRTWGATVAAAAVSAGASAGAAATARRRADLVPFDVAAALLGDTPAVARRSYVHPRAVEIGRSPAVRAAVEEAAQRHGSNDVMDVLHDPALQSTIAVLLVDDAGVG